MLKSCATALVAVVSLLAPMSASAEGLPARTTDPLVGTWDTAAIPLAKVRAAFTAYELMRRSREKSGRQTLHSGRPA